MPTSSNKRRGGARTPATKKPATNRGGMRGGGDCGGPETISTSKGTFEVGMPLSGYSPNVPLSDYKSPVFFANSSGVFPRADISVFPTSTQGSFSLPMLPAGSVGSMFGGSSRAAKNAAAKKKTTKKKPVTTRRATAASAAAGRR